jgi:hypothetical protein
MAALGGATSLLSIAEGLPPGAKCVLRTEVLTRAEAALHDFLNGFVLNGFAQPTPYRGPEANASGHISISVKSFLANIDLAISGL